MILIENDSGTIVIEAKEIVLIQDKAFANGRTYYGDIANTTHTKINIELPYGNKNHWRYANGTLELTELGILFTEEKQYQELVKHQKNLSDAIQKHLDAKAQEYRYDDIASARSYAGFTNAFQTEAVALGSWASNCWVYAGQVEADVILGTREMPTIDALIAELPILSMA